MEQKKTLDALRCEIDEIARSLVALYKRRMKVAANVAAYKKENGLPVLDASRERALLAKIAELAGEEHADSAVALYSTLLGLSRAYQGRLLGGEGEIAASVKRAIADTPSIFPERAAVACQGVEGAYSQIAAEKIFSYPNIRYYRDFDDVFSAIENGECEYGVLPIENSTAGSVLKVYDLMLRHSFSIVRSVRLKIDHNLLVNPGCELSDVKEIVSHEQAISQCRSFLRSLPDVKLTPVANTAVAAETVRNSGRRDIAALSSRDCAALYGLKILQSAVQDTGNNFTRFICISKNLKIFPGADRTSIVLTVSHKPGALYHILSRFYALGINLTKLESRPIPDRDFEFAFYFDLDISVYSPRFLQLLTELEHECDSLRYLGSYTLNG